MNDWEEANSGDTKGNDSVEYVQKQVGNLNWNEAIVKIKDSYGETKWVKFNEFMQWAIEQNAHGDYDFTESF